MRRRPNAGFRCASSGSASSDGMRVKLPEDRAARTAVLKVIRKHTPGFSASDDVRWNVAFLWWD